MQLSTAFHHSAHEAALLELLQEHQGSAQHQRTAAKGSAVITRLQHMDIRLGDGAHTHRQATCDRLGQRGDIWCDTSLRTREERAGASATCLHLIVNQQRARARAQLASRTDVLERQIAHASFTLDGFHDERSGANGLKRALQRGHIVGRNPATAGDQRFKRFAVLGRMGHRQGAHRASVEATFQSHKVGALGMTLQTLPFARQFERALVRFGAAVREEHRLQACQAR